MRRLNKLPKKNKNLAWRIIDQEAVIINLQGQPASLSEELHIFNPTATRIWQLCNGRNSMKEIISILQNEYAGDGKKIEQETQEAISKMLKQRLISL
ncbi:PqqD family protein [Candidatus Omnitrophota bacterium]